MISEYRRNHFVPEGYLTNFTNTEGKFYVFDKKAEYSSNQIRYVSPKQVCFEWDRYVLNYGDNKIYKGLESEVYSYFDGKFSKTLKLLQSEDFDWITCPKDTIGNLELMIPLFYWRSPISNKLFNDRLKKYDNLEDFGLIPTIDSKPIVDKEFHKTVLSDKNAQKAIIPILALASFGNPHPINDLLEWRVIYRDVSGAQLTSDNPIIFYNNPKEPEDFRSELILPVGNSTSLLRINENLPKNYHLLVYQDMLIFEQAKQYVICSNRWYLEEIIKYYQNYQNSQYAGQLKKLIFNTYHKK
jgi:hypothetical protein